MAFGPFDDGCLFGVVFCVFSLELLERSKLFMTFITLDPCSPEEFPPPRQTRPMVSRTLTSPTTRVGLERR